jgi:hypothetical protein
MILTRSQSLLAQMRQLAITLRAGGPDAGGFGQVPAVNVLDLRANGTRGLIDPVAQQFDTLGRGRVDACGVDLDTGASWAPAGWAAASMRAQRANSERVMVDLLKGGKGRKASSPQRQG